MLNSKEIKENAGRFWEDSKLDALTAPFRFISRKIRRAIYVLKWAIFLWDKYDFDSHYIYPVLRRKLELLHECLLNGFAIQESVDMKALKTAVRLAKRLDLDEYEHKVYDRHDKKWGASIVWFEPVKDRKGYSTFHSRRPNANTEEEKKTERAELWAAVEVVDRIRLRDKRNLFAIIAKYDRRWWD